MRVRWVTVAAMLIAASCAKRDQKPDWYYTGKSQNSGGASFNFIDKNSVHKVDGLPAAWNYIYAQNLTIEGVRYMTVLYAFDCQSDRAKAITARAFNDNDQPVDIGPYSTDWQYGVPGSSQEESLHLACGVADANARPIGDVTPQIYADQIIGGKYRP